MRADDFWGLFISTGYASRFGRGEAGVVAGLSGWELAVRILETAGRRFERRRPVESDSLPPPYWAGWALAKYQWYTDVVGRLAVALHVDVGDLYERVFPGNDYADFTHGG